MGLLLAAILIGYWKYLLGAFLVGLAIIGLVVARLRGWKLKLKVGLMMLLLGAYGIVIVVLLYGNLSCEPMPGVSVVQVAAIRVVLLLGAVCVILAGTFVRRRAFGLALACFTIPPIVAALAVAIIHLLIPGRFSCPSPGLIP